MELPAQLDRLWTEVRELTGLAAPLVAAQLAQIAINFVDTIMAGRLSATDLAAVSVGSNLWVMVWIFNLGVLLAVTPTVAHLFGARRNGDIGHSVRQGLWLSQLLAWLSVLVIRLGAKPLIELMQVDPEIVPTTMGYLQAIVWGMPAMCGFQVLRGYFEGTSRTKPIMIVSVIGLAGNVVGNYLFMYGKAGFPRLGAAGCGVASAIVMWLEFTMLIGLAGARRDLRTFGVLRRFEWPNSGEIRTLLALGLPMGLGLFMEASLFGTISLWMGGMGKNVVAGHQIALNVASITFMVPLGLSMAITVRVGQAAGAGRPEAARFSGLTGIGLAGTFMAAAGIVIFLVPELIAAIYTGDAIVRGVAISLLEIAAIFQIMDGLQVSGAGALRGLKDTKTPMMITALAYWLIGIPLAYTLGIVNGGGARGVWFGIIGGLGTAAVLLNTRFHRITSRVRAEV